ncbi:MAG: D-2-hydroxyacid dehydrogenase [Acidimicrobiia bacterium]
MRILLSDIAHAAYGPAIAERFPGATFAVMARDGSITADGGIDVAWATHDLFVEGPAAEYFAACSSSSTLRWFQSSGAGVDSPFFAALSRRGIQVTISHAASVPIAEFVMRSVLQWYQQPQRWESQRAARSWKHHGFREVEGTSWLVVGLGSIGTEVASRARAFGARVVGVRRSPTGSEPVDAMIAPARLVEASVEADVVVVSAPGGADTRHLIDERFLRRMRDGSLLVNVARGSLVDEAALLAALDRDGGLGGAVLDAVAVEPPPTGSPLWDHPKVMLTPHNSFAGDRTIHRNAALFMENLDRFSDGRALLNPGF